VSTLTDTLVEIFAPDREKGAPLVTRGDSYDLNGMRILLAEDNKINQQIAVELLEIVGASVEVVNNGREAIEKLAVQGGDSSFDVVLMDLQMPEMDGYQAAAQIRAIPPLGRASNHCTDGARSFGRKGALPGSGYARSY
jgi:two-component system, sensor histidine kinase and response regulator